MEPWSTTHTPINLLHPGFHVTFITTVIPVFNVSHLQILINICDLSTVADYYKSGCRSNSMCTPQFGTATDNPLIGDLAIRAQQNLARHLCSSLATTKERAISASTELAFFLLLVASACLHLHLLQDKQPFIDTKLPALLPLEVHFARCYARDAACGAWGGCWSENSQFHYENF